jgi:hypothetical protein
MSSLRFFIISLRFITYVYRAPSQKYIVKSRFCFESIVSNLENNAQKINGLCAKSANAESPPNCYMLTCGTSP